MDQPSATTPPAGPAQADDVGQAADAAASPAPSDAQSVGFGSRGRARRRARFLRKARELAYRDLGGLVYSLHHFGQRNDSLVLAKLATLGRIDAELRTLESSLSERQPVTVLREAGITACPRCAAIHSGEDRFCPNCGLPMSRNVDLLGDFQSSAGAAGTSGAAPSPAAGAVAAPASAPPAAPASPVRTPPVQPTAPGQATPPAAAPGTGAPSSPAPGQAEPATQSFAPVAPSPAAPGRSPAPPSRGAQSSPSQSGDDDQPTEIIRPPAAGS